MDRVSLLMPTYDRGFVIELAVASIVNQREHACEIELVIGDDGTDESQEIVASVRNDNPKLTIRYEKLDRMLLSDKRNLLVRASTGSHFGIVDSDDVQSPYKVAALERAVAAAPTANVFGQRNFLYHDLLDGRTVRWIQNKDLHLFKAGSFMVLRRDFWEAAGGYPPGLPSGVDSAFALSLQPGAIVTCDLGEIDPRLPDTTIATQHLNNIWYRDRKGLGSRTKQQLENYLCEPVDGDLRERLGPTWPAYERTRERVRKVHEGKSLLSRIWFWKRERFG